MLNNTRFIIYCPHWDPLFGPTLWNWRYKKKAISKYSYLIRNLINQEHRGLDVLCYVDKPKYLSWLPGYARLKFLFWAYLNNLKLSKIKIITSSESIKQNDIFFALGRTSLKRDNVDFLKNTKAKKIFHLTHYMTDTSKVAAKAYELEVDYFISENNLKKNSEYFKEYFYYYNKDVYVLPFVFDERFEKKKKFSKRINKAFVTGSLTIWDDSEPSLQDFFKFYNNTNNYHPARWMVLKNEDILKNEVDVYVRLIDNNSKEEKREDGHQNYYKSFDLVEKLNNYKMFISAEEMHDLPSIGFIEGMACGCAYIGKKDSMYEDIGLKEGVHYIGYDGTVDDLRVKVQYYQSNEVELKRIAEAGYEFVKLNFNGSAVTDRFVGDIITMSQSNYEKFHSSFTHNSGSFLNCVGRS